MLRKGNRLWALLLSAALLVTQLPAVALAAEGCNHQHDENCGYMEAVEGAPCTFQHEHDDACGYAEATEAAPCSVEAAHVHDDACGYVEAVKGQPCTHVCDECGKDDKDSGTAPTPGALEPASLLPNDLKPTASSNEIVRVTHTTEQRPVPRSLLIVEFQNSVDAGDYPYSTINITSPLGGVPPRANSISQHSAKGLKIGMLAIMPAGTYRIEVTHTSGGGTASAEFTVDPSVIPLDVVDGDGPGYTWNSAANVLTLTANGNYTITMYNPATATGRGIAVKAGVTAAITLDGVNINVSATSRACAFAVEAGSTANVTLSGTNALTSGGYRAGLEAPDGSMLTIDGGGSLTAKGGSYGAGIGGGDNGSGGTIEISGGTVTARGGDSSAGIGGGRGGSGGAVAISGEHTTVTATGKGGGFDVGAGNGGSCGSLSVTDGATLEMKNKGTDVTTPEYKSCTVTDGSTVTTYNESGQAASTVSKLFLDVVDADGTGYTWDGTSKILTITGSDALIISQTNPAIPITDRQIAVAAGVTANLTLDGVNIDVSRTDGACAFAVAATGTADLTLAGANTLRSAARRAGLEVPDGAALTIGGGGRLEAVCVMVDIRDGGGAGVGGGSGQSGGTITIGGSATIHAVGGQLAAGIGGGGSLSSGASGDGGVITIGGSAAVDAQGCQGAAGIGGGRHGGGTITIEGGATVRTGHYASLTLTNSSRVSSKNAGTILIRGNPTVLCTPDGLKDDYPTDYSGHQAAGIGGGAGVSDGGSITILGGAVNAVGGIGGGASNETGRGGQRRRHLHQGRRQGDGRLPRKALFRRGHRRRRQPREGRRRQRRQHLHRRPRAGDRRQP